MNVKTQEIKNKLKEGMPETKQNEMKIEFLADSVNEGFARTVVAAFISPLNPTIEELSDVKTAVSEAVTNAIIHGYDEEYMGISGASPYEMKVYIYGLIVGDVLHLEIWDKGKGIGNLEQAMEPLYTSKPQLDRSGMGFAFMEAFMDDLEVISESGQGTTVFMKKKIGITPWLGQEE